MILSRPGRRSYKGREVLKMNRYNVIKIMVDE
nr:MAG TPA: hypothetical protein [Caudoviricetes sp.]